MSDDLKKVAVIGTGVIGAGWIVRCLAHNKKVIAYDKNFKLKKELIDFTYVKLTPQNLIQGCLLYTSDAADDMHV